VIDLSSIKAEAPPVTADALQIHELERARAELERLRLENISLAQNTSLRRQYARNIFTMVAVWLAFVASTITASGLRGYPYFAFGLSDGVLIALMTTATATVVGVLLIVANYLFPRSTPN
jgi:hypothetical protein